MTWVEMGAGFRFRRLQTPASTSGASWAKVTTAPEILPPRYFPGRHQADPLRGKLGVPEGEL